MFPRVLVAPCIRPLDRAAGTIDQVYVYGRYLEQVVRHGLIPIILSPQISQAMLEQLVAECDGLLLCGGNDVDPHSYGEAAHPMTEAPIVRRDEIEIALVKLFSAAKKPILGICRGCQVIAVALGGSLHQHLPELVAGEVHKSESVKAYQDLVCDTHRHDILIDRDSQAFALLSAEKVSVNTAHHQSIKSVGDSLLIVARSPAGVVELVESSRSDHFIMGIQCHIEADLQQVLEPLFAEFARNISIPRSTT